MTVDPPGLDFNEIEIVFKSTSFAPESVLKTNPAITLLFTVEIFILLDLLDIYE